MATKNGDNKATTTVATTVTAVYDILTHLVHSVEGKHVTKYNPRHGQEPDTINTGNGSWRLTRV